MSEQLTITAPIIDTYLPAVYSRYNEYGQGEEYLLGVLYLKNVNYSSDFNYKIYTLNNQDVTEKFGPLDEIESNLNEIFITWDKIDKTIAFTFYKIAISVDGGPWSNFGVFKLTYAPEIISYNLKSNLQYEFTYDFSVDPTESIEKLEYYYLINGKQQERKTVYPEKIEDQYKRTFLTDSLFNYPQIRETSLEKNEISIALDLYSKNGVYTQTRKLKNINMTTNTNNILTLESVNSTSGQNSFQMDRTNYNLGIVVFNNGIKIFELTSDFKLQNFNDYTAGYLNFYEVFGITEETDNSVQVDKQELLVNNDFDGAFLIDIKNKRQLNISLNNKVSSFKPVRLEQKVDTIGGQYPVFFRNPSTNYREFPLSGTISYQSLISLKDSFYSIEELGLSLNKENYTICPSLTLEGKNLYAERIFREKVLEFLTQNRPLLYKSPTEGNIVVKLTNISLTPNQQLGRMIYDFSCTCYEVQDLETYLREEGYENAFISKE